MTRVLRFSLPGLLLFSLLFPSPLIFAQNAASGSVPLQGIIVAVSGSVQYRNTQVMLWENLPLGHWLSAGDRIRTGDDGQVKIEVNDGNYIYIKPNSEIFIKQLSENVKTGKYQTVFETIEAKVKAEVNDRKNLQTFEIRTPTAVAGVRGTVFYVNARQGSTEIFVERGKVNLRNNASQKDRNIQPGLAATADESGQVTKPLPPPPQRMQEFQASWEPLPPPPGTLPPPPDGQLPPPPGEPLPPPPDGQQPPPPGSTTTTTTTDPTRTTTYTSTSYLPPPPNSLTNEIYQQQTYSTMDQQKYLQDRQTTQQTTLTDYITNPPPPTGSNTSDTDGDGIPNLTDLDDDNDFLFDTVETANGTNPLIRDTDNDFLTDWEELRLVHTNKLNNDTDGDGILDGADAFPMNSALTTTMANIRTARYSKIGSISGLRSEIQTMLADSGERQRDFIMDRISDAQGYKVLKDRFGNWARVEQYIFRPTPQEIDVLNITYRQGLAAPMTSMQVKMGFNTNLNSLTSTQIKSLPWDKYFTGFVGQDINYGLTAPAYFPTSQSIAFGNETVNSVKESRTLAATISCAPNCLQQITSNTFTVNQPGAGINNVTDTFTSASVSGNNSPATMNYTADSASTFANFTISAIQDNGNLATGLFTYNSIWHVLGTNMAGPFNNIGANNSLQIDVDFNGGASITVIYLPIQNMNWRGTSNADWPQELTW